METFPGELHSDFQNATESLSTTGEGRKRIRIRYIPLTRLTDEHRNIVKEYLGSFKYLYSRTVKEQEEKTSELAESFVKMVKDSCRIYDR